MHILAQVEKKEKNFKENDKKLSVPLFRSLTLAQSLFLLVSIFNSLNWCMIVQCYLYV